LWRTKPLRDAVEEFARRVNPEKKAEGLSAIERSVECARVWIAGRWSASAVYGRKPHFPCAVVPQVQSAEASEGYRCWRFRGARLRRSWFRPPAWTRYRACIVRGAMPPSDRLAPPAARECRLPVENHAAHSRMASIRCEILSIDCIRVVMREHHLIVGIADGVVPGSNCRFELILMAI
jgi:hypothetical protein